MDSEQKIEERKKWNAPFLRAFNYLLEEGYAGTKGELCSMIGIQPGLISNYTKGTKKVSLDTMNALARVSKGELNVNYMLGKSEYMLVANVPDDELLEYHNPDRKVIEKRKAQAAQQPQQHIDQSSLVNAILAAKDQLIEELKEKYEKLEQEMAKMEREKDARIADITKLAEERLHRIAELRRVIDAAGSDINSYPFPIGAADRNRQKHTP